MVFPRASSPRGSSQAPSLEVAARASRQVDDFPVPLVDVAVAEEQPDALLAWFPALVCFQAGWVEPLAYSALLQADAQELPPAGCFPDGCWVAQQVDGSARAGYSAEPPADALAPRSADSLPADDYYLAAWPAHDYSAALLGDDSLPQAAGSVQVRGGLADCSVAPVGSPRPVGGSLPPPEGDWPEPLPRPDDSVPADFPDDSPAG